MSEDEDHGAKRLGKSRGQREESPRFFRGVTNGGTKVAQNDRHIYTRGMPGDFWIGEWHVQPSINRISRGSEVVRVEPKVMQVLVCLAGRPGEVVTREELIASVWAGIFVTDDVLHRAVRELRRVFGDSAGTPRYIETIRKRGYRLIAATEVTRQHTPTATANTVIRGAFAARVARRPWPLAAFAAALLVACGMAVLALVWRPTPLATEARARFVPVVSSPLNESDPAIAPDGQRVAYIVRSGNDTGHSDIYLQPRLGMSPLRLTSNEADDRRPTFSPDGRRLGFVRLTGAACDLYVLSIESGLEQRVAPCGNTEAPQFTWASSDALLLSEAPQGSHYGWRIARMSVSGGDRHVLSTPPAGVIGDHSPATSPDGRHLAFIRQFSGGAADLFVMPIGGGDARRVTFDESDITGVDWTSGGRELIYSSDRAGGYSLWRVSTGGGVPQLAAGGAARLKHPVSALGGRRVAYESWHYEINIWDAPVDSPSSASREASAVVRTSEQWNLYPQLSPDESRVAFVSTQSGGHELWVAARDGSGARQLTSFASDPIASSGGASVRGPRWSPDGRRIIFTARRNGAVDVFSVDVESAQITSITNDPVVEIAPSWSQDGSRVFYGSRAGGDWNVWSHELTGQGPTLAIAGGFAAQAAPDGSALYFTRPDTGGIWRIAPGTPAARVADTTIGGNWANWTVNAAGVFVVASMDRGVSLYRAPLAGGALEEVARLPNFSWPGITVSLDGSRALYARWDRRDSNIMSIEMER